MLLSTMLPRGEPGMLLGTECDTGGGGGACEADPDPIMPVPCVGVLPEAKMLFSESNTSSDFRLGTGPPIVPTGPLCPDGLIAPRWWCGLPGWCCGLPSTGGGPWWPACGGGGTVAGWCGYGAVRARTRSSAVGARERSCSTGGAPAFGMPVAERPRRVSGCAAPDMLAV